MLLEHYKSFLFTGGNKAQSLFSSFSGVSNQKDELKQQQCYC